MSLMWAGIWAGVAIGGLLILICLFPYQFARIFNGEDYFRKFSQDIEMETCPICDGVGWVRPSGEPFASGAESYARRNVDSLGCRACNGTGQRAVKR